MYSGIQAPFTKDRLNSHPTSPPSPGSWARPAESVTLVPRGTPLVPQCPAPPGPYPPRGPVETCGKMVSNVVHPRTNHNKPSYHHKQRIIHNYTLLLRSWMVPSPDGIVCWSTLMCPKWLSESTMIAEKCGNNHGSCCMLLLGMRTVQLWNPEPACPKPPARLSHSHHLRLSKAGFRKIRDVRRINYSMADSGGPTGLSKIHASWLLFYVMDFMSWMVYNGIPLPPSASPLLGLHIIKSLMYRRVI